MSFKTLLAAHARSILESRREGISVNISRYESLEGPGDPLDETPIIEAVENVNSLIGQLASQPIGERNRNFDSEVSILLHRDLNIDRKMAGAPEFWTWLAIVHFSEAVEWRTRGNNEFAHFENYGIGSRWRNLLARLWFRAELSHDNRDDDPYRLTRRGQVDFWESGIIRRRYASCRELTRAFVRFQYPEESRPSHPTLSLTHRNGVRELYKRLRRLQTTITYEFLSDECAYDLVSHLSSDLQHA